MQRFNVCAYAHARMQRCVDARLQHLPEFSRYSHERLSERSCFRRIRHCIYRPAAPSFGGDLLRIRDPRRIRDGVWPLPTTRWTRQADPSSESWHGRWAPRWSGKPKIAAQPDSPGRIATSGHLGYFRAGLRSVRRESRMRGSTLSQSRWRVWIDSSVHHLRRACTWPRTSQMDLHRALEAVYHPTLRLARFSFSAAERLKAARQSGMKQTASDNDGVRSLPFRSECRAVLPVEPLEELPDEGHPHSKSYREPARSALTTFSNSFLLGAPR
jgi:hypothetical protein